VVLPHAGWHWAMTPGPVDDLAMLELDHYVQLQPFTIAATVRAKSDVRLLGWGVTEPSGEGPLPVALQELDNVRLLPPDRCAAGGITAGELCLSNVNGTDGPCFGDSGGPALQRVPGTSRWVTIGGASRETAPACGTAPTIYTNLTDFRGWVYEVARKGTVPPAPAAVLAVTGKPKQLRWSGLIVQAGQLVLGQHPLPVDTVDDLRALVLLQMALPPPFELPKGRHRSIV